MASEGAVGEAANRECPGGDEWMRHMRRGDFSAAWNVSDAVMRSRAGVPCWDWPRHYQYVWDGRSLRGKRVLVRCYHGLGDTIQFIRYMPMLRELASEVIVWAQPVLLPLLETVGGIDRLLPLHDGAPEADYEADVESMELPHVFRTSLETIPQTVPYVKACDERARQAGPAGSGRLEGVRSGSSPPGTAGSTCRLRVGIAWRGGDWNEERDLPAVLLPGLAGVPGVEWHVLQDRRRAAEWPAGRGVFDCPEPVERLAATISGMDLVITIDSLPAHLAGALAVPVWTLLQREADWRWMEGREDSPWYPTMRLWRQERAGDWEPVVARVNTELARCVDAGRTGR